MVGGLGLVISDGALRRGDSEPKILIFTCLKNHLTGGSWAHLVSLNDVLELTSLFLLDVRRQEDSRPGQTVILEQKRDTNWNKFILKRQKISLI